MGGLTTATALAGWVLFALAAGVGGLNFYLSFLRVPLLRWLGRECSWVSGYPLFGNLLLAGAVPFLYHSPFFWWGAGVVALLDTGGLPWFVVILLWETTRRG